MTIDFQDSKLAKSRYSGILVCWYGNKGSDLESIDSCQVVEVHYEPTRQAAAPYLADFGWKGQLSVDRSRRVDRTATGSRLATALLSLYLCLQDRNQFTRDRPEELRPASYSR
jgi:hypothetical protein